MKIKTLLIVSAIGIALATPESMQAQLRPKPVKPDVGDVKEGGKERPKFDTAKIKERLKAAFDKRKKDRGDAKKKGLNVGGKKGPKGGGAFGKLVRDDEKVKELRESFKAAAKEQHENVKGLHKQLKDASDEDKDGLREQLKGLRTEWVENMKSNREEWRARIKEIREEFKNKRDEVIDANDDDGDDDPGE